MGRSGISEILAPIFLILLQVLVFKDVVLFSYAFCFLYVFLYLRFPIDMNPLAQLIVAFLIGMIVDLFYNTPGVHTSASLALVFVKIYWIAILTPSGGYDSGARISLRSQGLQWFLGYTFPLIFLHALVLFLVEAAGFGMFWQTLLKAFYSSVFTLCVLLIIQYLFYKKVR